MCFQRAEFTLNYLRDSLRELILRKTIKDSFEFPGVHASFMKVLDELLQKSSPFLSKGLFYWIKRLYKFLFNN